MNYEPTIALMAMNVQDPAFQAQTLQFLEDQNIELPVGWENLSVDELERTAAVLLVPGAPHRAVEQSHRILAEESVTGRFPQDDSLLQDKTQRETFTM